MTLPVYVINLDSSYDRWETLVASAALHAPQFNLSRISAIDGKAPEWFGRPGADEVQFALRCGRLIKPGEYGCHRSHLLALEAFLAEGAPYGLILEDDVEFNANSATRILAVLDALPDFGVIKIVNHRSTMLTALGQTMAGDVIGRTLHGPQGSAAAYLVSRTGARTLLASLRNMNLPWDVALERFWHHGAAYFSTKTNLLAFSEHASRSNIANDGYSEGKFPWYRRIGTAFFRFSDYVRRVLNTLPYPAEKFVARQQVPMPARLTWTEPFAAMAVLVMVSAVWIETDAYRFAALALTIPALYRYFRTDFWHYAARPYIGPVGMLCLFWGAYVAIRFVYDYLLYPEHGMGSSEGIYLFTLLYPAMGAAILVYCRRQFVIATAFMIFSLSALTLGNSFSSGDEQRALTLLHNNPIHASVGAGFIALCSIPYLLHVLGRPGLGRVMRLALSLLSCATFVAALLVVYSSMSKGVWLALSVALPLLAIIIVLTDSGRWGKWMALAIIAAGAVAMAAKFEVFSTVAGPTVQTSLALTEGAISGEGLRNTIDDLIASPATPISARERLMLWANGLDIWERHLVFGAGIGWMHEWESRPYQETSFNLLHNGYMEIVVRYGLVGLMFYLALFAWCSRRVWLAAQAGVIDVTAFPTYLCTLIFFAITLLSNSNIRLAIGEAYMWIAAGYGFYCHYLLQQPAHQKS